MFRRLSTALTTSESPHSPSPISTTTESTSLQPSSAASPPERRRSTLSETLGRIRRSVSGLELAGGGGGGGSFSSSPGPSARTEQADSDASSVLLGEPARPGTPPRPPSARPSEHPGKFFRVRRAQSAWVVDPAFVSSKTSLVPKIFPSPSSDTPTNQMSAPDLEAWRRKNDFLHAFPDDAWTDCDAALFELGKALSIFSSTDKLQSFKWVFWTENELQSALLKLMLTLVDSGEVESRAQPDFQFRTRRRAPRGSPQKLLSKAGRPRLCVIAIDFGSTHSGYAFASVAPPNTMHLPVFKSKRGEVLDKQPTCAVFDASDMRLERYGLEARDWYLEALGASDLLRVFNRENKVSLLDNKLYFDGDIKMRLFHPKGGEGKSEPLLSRTVKTVGHHRSVPLMTVVSKILERIKSDALIEVNAKLASLSIAPPDVQWIVTVPSVWDEEAHAFMRQACVNAGMIREVSSSHLVLVLEPEAALLAAYVSASDKSSLKRSDRVVVIDAGGGTVDVCALQVESEDNLQMKSDFKCKQLVPSSGLGIGGLDVDRRFLEFLGQFFGEEFFARFPVVCPAAYIELVHQQWEDIKLSMSLEDYENPGRYRTLDVTYVLAEMSNGMSLSALCKRYNAGLKKAGKSELLNVSRKKSASDTIKIYSSLIRSFFDPVVDEIVNHVRKVFIESPSELSSNPPDNLVQILLVGGFGSCPLIQAKIERAFPRCRVMTSPRGAALVEFGGVLSGLRPGVISSRKSRITMGLKTTIPYDSKIHIGQQFRENKQYDRLAKTHYVKNVFLPIIARGETVQLGEAVSHTFSPSSSEVDSIKFDLYTCDQNPPVKFVTEEGCRRLATVVIPIRPGEDNDMEVTFNLAEAEIIAVVKRKRAKDDSIGSEGDQDEEVSRLVLEFDAEPVF